MSKIVSLNRLNNFLSVRKSPDTGRVTHTAAASPYGKYFITRTDTERFHKLYWESVSSGNLHYLIELNNDSSPIKIDIDLKIKLNTEEEYNNYEEGNKSHIYTDSLVHKFILGYVNELEKVIDPESTELENKYYAVLLEKPRFGINKEKLTISDGFHILFPHIILPVSVQHYIREAFVQSDEYKSLFAEYNTLIGSIDNIFDKGVVGRGWTLYGSCGKRGGAMYKITRVFNIKRNEDGGVVTHAESPHVNLLERYKGHDIVNLMSILGKSEIGCYRENMYDRCNDWFYDNTNHRAKGKRKNMKIDSAQLSAYEIERIRMLVKCLSEERSSNYEDWIRVCWCLYNIGGKDLFFQEFINFSQLCPEKFDMASCEKFWNASRDNKELGIGSLRFWARHDDFNQYQLINLMDVSRGIERLPETNVGIARCIQSFYSSEFLCADPGKSESKRKWYHFIGHRWNKNSLSEIRSRLTNEVMVLIGDGGANRKQLLDYGKRGFGRDIGDSDGGFKKLKRIRNSLESTVFVDKVLKELGFFLRNEDFLDQVDKNPDLIGFENGVYELNTGKFREGLPEDMITFSTGIDYEPDHPDNANVEKFMEEILPNPAVREYALLYLSTCLYGHNEKQKFIVLTGEGGNGKSMLVNLLTGVLGDYSTRLSTALITQKRQKSETASPGIMKLKNKRLAFITEPEEDDILNMGIIKELTGGDRIAGRNLFEGEEEFVNHAKLFMLCNNLPRPSSQDQGVWRRVRVIHFPLLFVDNPTEDFHRKRDYTIDEKTRGQWLPAFMNLLLKYYKLYRNKYRGEIHEPKEVIAYTDEYQENTDVFAEFIKEKLVPDAKGKETMSDLYIEFKGWYNSSYVKSGTCPAKKKMKSYFKKKFKNKFDKDSNLRGYSFKEDLDSEDEDSDDEVENGKEPVEVVEDLKIE